MSDFAFIPMTTPYVDLQTRAYARLLSQFRQSTLLEQVLNALMSEVQVLSNTFIDIQNAFVPGNLQGAQLDVVGAIVGVPRDSGYTQPILPWAAEDGINTICAEDGTDFVWDSGTTVSQYILSDYQYFRAIQAQVFRNFCKYGSIPEVQEFFRIAYSIDVVPLVVGPMSIILMVPVNTDPALISIMTKTKSNNTTDLPFYAPYPATLEVFTLQFQPLCFEDGTQWDTEDGQDIYTEGIAPFTLNGVTYE